MTLSFHGKLIKCDILVDFDRLQPHFYFSMQFRELFQSQISVHLLSMIFWHVISQIVVNCPIDDAQKYIYGLEKLPLSRE